MSRMLPWKRFPWNVEKAERGAALVWLSLMLTFLIGAAAFAVDLGWLYVNSSRIQRTADAAALGGVTLYAVVPGHRSVHGGGRGLGQRVRRGDKRHDGLSAAA